MLVLIGKSGSGKTTICDLLCKNEGFVKATSYTTRAPRKGETTGTYYKFISKLEFAELYLQNKILEKTVYNDQYYGLANESLNSNTVAVVDPAGAITLKKLLGNKAIVVFLDISEAEQYERLQLRGDKAIDIESRLTVDNEVFDINADYIDYIIQVDNKYPEQMVSTIVGLVERENQCYGNIN